MFSQGTVADDLEGKEVDEAVAVDNTGGGWNKRLDGAKFGGSSETSMQLFLLLSRTYNIDKENCKIYIFWSCLNDSIKYVCVSRGVWITQTFQASPR